MSLTTDDLIKKSQEHRKSGRYAEALLTAKAAAAGDPENAGAWWQIAMCHLVEEEYQSALAPIEQTLKFAPTYAYGWASYGDLLRRLDRPDDALEALKRALEENPQEPLALRELARLYQQKGNNSLELNALGRLERATNLSLVEINRIGNLHYQQSNFIEAARYYRQLLGDPDEPSGPNNLALVYAQPEISREIDAIDLWRGITTRLPTYQRAHDGIAKHLPRLIERAEQVRQRKQEWLNYEERYRFYLNPFELLQIPRTYSSEECDAKVLLKFKKVLLQEIELENGQVAWLGNALIERSNAIAVCDELNNPKKRDYHWAVFQNEPLLKFLTCGMLEHFLIDHDRSPLDTIALFDAEPDGFGAWLSPYFAQVYDTVLGRTIAGADHEEIECLLDGRLWVMPNERDACFSASRRAVSRKVDGLRRYLDTASEKKPRAEEVQAYLDESETLILLNLLSSDFENLQTEAITLIRSVSLACNNIHNDPTLARHILEIAQKVSAKTSASRQQIKEDIERIDELIREEHKDEVRLVRGGVPWEITKQGARIGDQFIPTASVTSVRWGLSIREESSKTTHDFLISIKNGSGQEARYVWSVFQDVEKQKSYFFDLVNAVISYHLPVVIDRVKQQLDDGAKVRIGPCQLSNAGVEYETSGWIFSKTHLVPLRALQTNIENGVLAVFDASAPRSATRMTLRDTDNAFVLHYLAKSTDK